MGILRIARSACAVAMIALAAPAANAAGGGDYESQDWSFGGIFGTFDQAAAQRGYQVYRNVCAGCHAMKLMSYRYLEGIGVPDETVKAIASQDTKMVINGDGEEVEVQRLPSDQFPSPFPNEQAARSANGGAYPPDLSLIAKARADGPNYLYALLTGYHEAPADFVLNEGMYYNEAFGGHQIAMAAPLYEDAVEYADGTPATVEQMSHDVVTFLAFAGEPHMDERKRTGLKVVLFLFILTVMLYFVKKKVWADVKH